MNTSYYGIRPNISQAYIFYASQSTSHKLLNTVIIHVSSYKTFPRNYTAVMVYKRQRLLLGNYNTHSYTQNIWTGRLFCYTPKVTLYV